MKRCIDCQSMYITYFVYMYMYIIIYGLVYIDGLSVFFFSYTIAGFKLYTSIYNKVFLIYFLYLKKNHYVLVVNEFFLHSFYIKKLMI